MTNYCASKQVNITSESNDINYFHVKQQTLFIAAAAVANKLPLATLNRKHFERIEALKMID